MDTNDHVTVDIPPEIDELYEIETELETSPQEYNDNPTRTDELYDAALKKLYDAAVSNDWKKAYKEVFKKDPLKNSEYLTARIADNGDTALHVAIRAGSASFVKKMLKFMTREQLTCKNCYGNTAFLLAASLGRLKLVKMMFKKNEELAGIRGERDMFPIHATAMEGHYKMMKFLYRVEGPLQKFDSDRLFLNSSYKTFLFDDPTINEDLEKLYILTLRNDWNTAFRHIFKEDPIENSKYLTTRISKNEDIALHVAIASQSFMFAEELIKYMKREDLAIKNIDSNTAFFLVTACGNVRLAKQMFEKNGELPNICGKNEMLPIHKAAEKDHKLMVEFLYGIQRPLEEMDSNKLSAIASKYGLSEEIFENVASPPLTNQAENEPFEELPEAEDGSHGTNEAAYLSLAAKFNDWDIAYLYVFEGDSFKYSKYLTAKISEHGNTALHVAIENNSIEFVKELVKYMLEEELTIRNDDEDTAFLLAAENGSMEAAMVMFEKNRWLPSIRGYSDDLPIHRAAKSGHKEIVEFLYGIQGPLQEIDNNRLFLNVANRVSLFGDSQTINKNLEQLYIAVSNNDWNRAYIDVFESDPPKNSTYLTARVSEKEDTILHIAAKTKSFAFFEEALKYMKKEDLAIKNSDGNSAFFLIAASGDVRLAKEMFEKDVELPIIRGEREMLPIHKAAEQGHKSMVDFLYGIQQLEEMDSKKLSYYWEKGQYIIKKLYRAARKGDWRTTTKVSQDHPNYTKAQISLEGDTVLHIAVTTQSSVFVKKWINRMNPKDLAIKNHDGNTAFCLAAASGNLKIVKKMLNKNMKLRSIRGGKGMLPINMAAQSGHKEMVKFLYEDFLSVWRIQDKYLNEEDHCKLIQSLIRTGIYDLALELLTKKPELATWREESNGETALHILARGPVFANKKGSDKVHQERPQKLPPEALELVKWLLQQIKSLDEEKISKIIDYTEPVIFTAVRQGNIVFLAIFIREFPNLVLKVEQNNHSIFHVAVLYRQKDIFKLIYNISLAYKKRILQSRDTAGNNILHLAGMMPRQERLNTVSGVALQLQQELFWFEEVSKIVDPKDAEAKNEKGETPKDLFNKKITDLKDKGEKWMKDTANSCMIVATLITTVVFAAAFTVPGGIKDEIGTPNFIQKVSFTMFVISDAISLVSSSCSILTFLSILTARYADDDFRYVLPRWLVVGLLTLFFSIVAMMVVFCTTIFIVYKDGKIWIPIVVTVFASFPVILFTIQQWKLLYDVVRLTFTLSFLFKKNKNSLFEDDDNEEKSWRPIKNWMDSACWNFLEECRDSTFFYYFRECSNMFLYCCFDLFYWCRDMCSKVM